MDTRFDPDAPATDGDGIFGLPHSTDDARVVVIPVPFEATASSGHGTADAPAAVLVASHQVDLTDLETGEPWREGIAMGVPPAWLIEQATRGMALADQARDGDASALSAVNRISARVSDHVEQQVLRCLQSAQIPAVLGGDHSVPLGAFRAAAATHPGFGILHVDAHADLREAYEGFTESHASIFYNALQLEELGCLVQVGLRDLGRAERVVADNDDRVHWLTDIDLADKVHAGQPFKMIAEAIVAPLPRDVWISFDIDGLDPALCPNTGTPVPGGLQWREVLTLLKVLGSSGRRIIGFDLCEVGPESWDATVGARLLYKLSGWALKTQRENA